MKAAEGLTLGPEGEWDVGRGTSEGWELWRRVMSFDRAELFVDEERLTCNRFVQGRRAGCDWLRSKCFLSLLASRVEGQGRQGEG